MTGATLTIASACLFLFRFVSFDPMLIFVSVIKLGEENEEEEEEKNEGKKASNEMNNIDFLFSISKLFQRTNR